MLTHFYVYINILNIKMCIKGYNMLIDRFKEAYKQRDFKTYKEFGKFIGVSDRRINAMACGQQKITPEIAFRLEHFCSINPFWLLFGVGDMYEAKFDLGGEKAKFDDTQNFDELLEIRLQHRCELLKKNIDLKDSKAMESYKKSEDDMLCDLIKEVADKDYKRGLMKQLEIIRDCKK